ncbi:MAG: EAL domain-containing protein, partial [Proteobacteria bacterium]|nr:EAL domain-containing protein [Pseudomonadota bacterium]
MSDLVKQGIASVLMLPITVEDKYFGVVALADTMPQQFPESELSTLMRFGEDLGFAIETLRKRHRQDAREQMATHLLEHDAATGLPTRTLLKKHLDELIVGMAVKRSPLAVMVLQIDNLREVSDTFSFSHGDALLNEIGARLRGSAGQSAYLARYSEEGMAVILPAAGAVEARRAAHKIHVAFASPCWAAGIEIEPRIRIGIAIFPGHGSDAEILLRRASLACERARETAEGFIFHSGEPELVNARRVELATDLRNAIEAGDLTLYCQPKIMLADNSVCGMELLSRWTHPKYGRVPPSEFVPLAEQTGLIKPLTDWVLKTAAADWHVICGAEGAIRFAVNVATRNLLDPWLVERIDDLLTTWGIVPSQLQIEITESDLMHDFDVALEVLNKLRARGIELQIDDFGTGHSALAYLQRLPVTTLKIDQSFVRPILTDPVSHDIVRTVIQLAHNIGMKTVAEGIESAEIQQCLLELGSSLFIFEMGRVYDAANYANANIVPSLLTLDDASRTFGRMRVRIYRHLLNGDPADRREIESTINEAGSALEKSLKDYAPLVADDKDRLLLAADHAALTEYASHIAQILASSRSNKDQEALALINHAMPYAEKVNEALDAHMDYNMVLGKNSAAAGAATKANAIWILIVLGGALLLTVVLLAFLITRGLSQAMMQSAGVAAKIAQGDLSSRITVKGDDETVAMLESLQAMQSSLSQIVSEIRHMVEAAALRGDFSIRLSMQGKTGFVKDLSELLNRLSSVTEAGLTDSVRMANAIALGDATQNITQDYPGAFGEMANALVALQRVSIELADQRWAKEHLAEILHGVQRVESLQEFGEALLARLCPPLGAAQGLVYADIDSVDVQQPVGGYGRAADGPAYALGEGAVGQCARDLRPLLLDDPSGSVLRLSSGLVDAAPRLLVLMPLLQRHSAIGVIELALLVVPDLRQRLLLDALPEAVAPLLEVLRRNLRTVQLAGEIQMQAEELEAQKQELLRSAASLRQKVTMMNEILAAATEVGIIGTDLAGVITLFNSGAESMLGWDSAEMIGRETPARFHLAEEIEAEAAKLGVNNFQAIVAGTAAEGRASREWTFVRKDGSQFTGQLLTTLIHGADGSITGYLGIIQDVTLRHQLEDEMAQARALAEDTSRLKSDFLANMSHEIRTPMNAIIGMAHLALNTELTPRQRDYLKKIQLSGKHLLAIINDILDISKIEAGRLSVERSEFELETVLANVINLIGDKATEKGLELVLDVASDVPVDVIGDSLRLGQVLINYANNALKFTERGEIDILVRLREQTEDSVLLWFAVRDTGIGLSAEQIRH